MSKSQILLRLGRGTSILGEVRNVEIFMLIIGHRPSEHVKYGPFYYVRIDGVENLGVKN